MNLHEIDGTINTDITPTNINWHDTYWTTATGQTIPIELMSDTHLRNTREMLIIRFPHRRDYRLYREIMNEHYHREGERVRLRETEDRLHVWQTLNRVRE